MVLLSIAFNTWPGTDLYRFALLLETLLYRPSEIEDYLKLVQILNGWEPHKWTIPKNGFESYFIENNFKRVEPSHPKELELILAMDGESNEHEDYFIKFCEKVGVNWQIVHKYKIGVAGMRNAVMQIFKGDYLTFSDDDDMIACLEDLYIQSNKLKGLGMGSNDTSYWKTILSKRYDDVYQLQRDLWRYQKKPTMAMVITGIRIKNTWGSKENPFSITPLPLDANGAVLVDRGSYFSMCSKVFSRESLHIINNSINLGSMEDSRSFHTEEWPQKCFYILRKNKYDELTNGYKLLKRYVNKETLSDDEFQILKSFIIWCNNNILPFKYTQLTFNKDHPNMETFERIFPYFIMYDVVSFCYTFPSGHYSRNSWAWAGLIGTLEAFRNMHRSVDFTTLDMQRAKKLITSCIHTEITGTACACEITSLVDDADVKEIAKILNDIVAYKFIYWTAIVNKKQDWEFFEKSIARLKELLDKVENKSIKEIEGADRIQEIVYHPNQSAEFEIITAKGKEIKSLSLSNCKQVDKEIDLLRTNYTERFIDIEMGGGEIKYTTFDDDTQPTRNLRPTIDPTYADDINEINSRGKNISNIMRSFYISHSMCVLLIIIILLIILFSVNGYSSYSEQPSVYTY